MPPLANHEETLNRSAVSSKNRAVIADKKIMDDAPLFAGLDDFVLVVAEKKSTGKQADLKKEKKKTVALKTKPANIVQPVPQTAPKVPKTKPNDPNSMLLSVVEMCTLLKISRATLVRMDKSGQLPGRLKVGGSVRFHRETIENWLRGLINSHPTP